MNATWASVLDGVRNSSVTDEECVARLETALESAPDTEVVVDKNSNILHLAVVTIRPIFLAKILETAPAQ